MSSLQRLFFVFCAVILSCALSSAQGPPHNKYMVCYISTWAIYRDYPANFFPRDIDPTQCTHLMYAFAGLDENTHRVYSLDPGADLDVGEGGQGLYRQMTDFKFQYPHIKVLLAVGGWDEGSEKYSVMASNQDFRASFINSAIEMIMKYNFDGFDLDWEYPGSRGGGPDDKQNFVTLARELREAFNPYGWLLTTAVGAGPPTMDAAYDFPALAPYFDIFNLMAYDYHGGWDRRTGANSPFYHQDDGLSVTDTVQYLFDHGAPIEKFVLGLPLYGQTFIMDNPQTDGNLNLGVPCAEEGFPGAYTGQAGFMGNQETCGLQYDQYWQRFWDPNTGTPFYLNYNWLLSYDDGESLRLKIEHAVSRGFGGLMVWSMDTDDFRGGCNGVVFPTMKFINGAIRDLTQ